MSEIEFRGLTHADLPVLAEWLSRPHVVKWWRGGDAQPNLAAVREKYLPRLSDRSPVRGFIAFLDGERLGFIQSYVALGAGDGWWEDEADPGVRGIDLFLADGGKLGQGFGTRMVSAFVKRLLADPSVTKVQTDPDPGNARAIRCYAKSGFVPIREVVTPDGPALLMVAERARDSVSGGAL